MLLAPTWRYCTFEKELCCEFVLSFYLFFPGHCPLLSIPMCSLTTDCLPTDLVHQSPEDLIAFDPVCHAVCNCPLLKAFEAIKSFSVLGAWQHISALIRTLGCQRSCPPRANPAPRGAVPTKLIILYNRTSWKTATAAQKIKVWSETLQCDLYLWPPSSLFRLTWRATFPFSSFLSETNQAIIFIPQWVSALVNLGVLYP